MSNIPDHPHRERAPRRMSAIVLTLAIALHWIPAYWFLYVEPILDFLRHPWPYMLSMLSLGVMLTAWSPRAMGLGWGDTWKERRFVAVVGGGMTLVSVVVMLWVRAPLYGGSSSFYLVGPLYEELLFRGFLFAVVVDAFPRTWRIGSLRIGTATLITGVAFGVWHLGGLQWPADGFILFQVIYTTIAGVLFALMRERTGSLWPCLLVHFLVNLWSVEVPGIWGQWTAG